MPSIEEVSSTKVSKLKREVVPKPKEEWVESEKELTVDVLWEVEEESSSSSSSSLIASNIEVCHNFTDYMEPILTPPANVVNLLVISEIEIRADQRVKLERFDIRISAFRATVRIPYFKLVTIYFPCAVDPCKASCKFSKVEGAARRHRFELHVAVDREDWSLDADPGSKNWLMRLAMRDEVGENPNPYIDSSISSLDNATESSGNSFDQKNSEDDEELPEDKFQVRMPKNVNKYTGLPEPVDDSIPEGPLRTQQLKERDDNTEFAEDRFHKKDATSQYIINQREQAVKDKWAKHEKEKSERVDDPSVEYIDVDDFKPGGKYGPSKAVSVESGDDNISGFNVVRAKDEALAKASDIVKKGIVNLNIEGENSGDTNEEMIKEKKIDTTSLKSSLWSELLD